MMKAHPHREEPLATFREKASLAALETRFGASYVRARLRFERDYEDEHFRQNSRLLSAERWLSNPILIRGGLRLLGLHGRGRRNAMAVGVRRCEVSLPHLPDAFDGYRILHLSDLHLDMNDAFPEALFRRVRPLGYDLCVLTGDYRALTYGRYDRAMEGLRRLRDVIATPVYAILGNHDTIRMALGMEAMGYGLLLNETVRLPRGGDVIYLTGIDDADYGRTGDIRHATSGIAPGAVSILLAHMPEPYREAAHAGFDLMLCGHTHGGQICLPGGIPIRTESRSPRRFSRGAWEYGGMFGYTSAGAGTSIVDVRLNCPPEVTLHRFRRGPARFLVMPDQ